MVPELINGKKASHPIIGCKARKYTVNYTAYTLRAHADQNNPPTVLEIVKLVYMRFQPYQKPGRIFYGLAISFVGIQQMFYGQFARLLFPTWAEHVPGEIVIATLGSLMLIAAGLLVAFSRNPRPVALILGGALLFLFVFSYVPYNLFFFPAEKSFGIWGNALKELALSGGAFVIAGQHSSVSDRRQGIFRALAFFVPAGPVFFAITMTSFGIMHFMYPAFVATLIPAWIPFPVFWTWAAGILLVLAGIAIAIKIKDKPAAFWLAVILLLWIVVIHIPRAMAQPLDDRGNDVIALFTAIAFCGIALAIAANQGGERS